MSVGFGFSLPALAQYGGGGNNPFGQLGPTLDLAFADGPTGVGDLSDPNGYTLNTDFISPEYQVAAQYTIWETNVGLVDKTFSQIVTFTRASTATFFNSAGVLTSAAINAPRLDYNPATLAAQGLLIEEQRTNSQLQSEDLSNAGGWGVLGATITTNATAAPTGAVTADKLVEDSSTGAHQIASINAVTAGIAYTFSFFAKPAERTKLVISGMGLAGAGLIPVFTLIGAGSVAGGPTGTTITALNNGWYRCFIPYTPTNTTPPIYILDNGSGTSYTGNGTSGLYIWGAQIEVGAFATSYIPTTTTALTRSADVASVNTLSPWYNATEGTLYAEFTRGYTGNFSNFAAPAVITNNLSGASANSIASAFTNGANQQLYNSMIANNVEQLTYQQETAQTTNKTALAYKTNDTQQFTNGAAETADTSCTVPTSVSQMNIGSAAVSNAFINSWIRRITYYPRRLSQADGIAITT